MSFSPEAREVLATNAYYVCEYSNGTIPLPWSKNEWSMPYPTPNLRGTIFWDPYRTQPVRVKSPYNSWLRQDITEWLLEEEEAVVLQELKAAIEPPEVVKEPTWAELDSDDEEFWNSEPVFKYPIVTDDDEGTDVAADNHSIDSSDQETMHILEMTDCEVAIAEEVDVLTLTEDEAKLSPSSSGSPSPPRRSSSSTPASSPDYLTKTRDFWADPDSEEEAIWADAKSFEPIDLSVVLKKLAAERELLAEESAVCYDVDVEYGHATAVDLESESDWDPYADSSMSSSVAVTVEKGRVFCDRGTQTDVLRKKRMVCDKGAQTGEKGVSAAKVFSSVGLLVSAAVVFAGVWRVLGRN